MSDLPNVLIFDPPAGVISPSSDCSHVKELTENGVCSSATWPTANLALYIPFTVSIPITVYQIATYNGSAVSGTFDVGIYDVTGVRLVSWAAANSNTGVTQAGTTTLQLVDIADTALTPGVYFYAQCVDNITAAFLRWTTGFSAIGLEGFGVQQQAVGSVVLPSTATFANPANAYIPMYSMTLNSVT